MRNLGSRRRPWRGPALLTELAHTALGPAAAGAGGFLSPRQALGDSWEAGKEAAWLLASPPGTRPTEQPLWSSAPAAMSDGSSQKAPTEPRVQFPSPSDPANPIQPRGGHVTLAWTTGGPHPLVTVIGSRWPRRGQAASSES